MAHRPKRSGKAGCIGDIGTHAWHLSEYITGLKVKELCADLKAFVPGRPIDDDGAAFLRYENGVTGVLTATQIGTGEANNIRIRIYGEKGGLEWRQMEPNTLTLRWRDRPTEILDIGNNGYLTPEACGIPELRQDTRKVLSKLLPISTAISHLPSELSKTEKHPVETAWISRPYTMA